VELDAHRPVPSASTIKVPILVAALAALSRGDLRLDQPVDLAVTRVGGSGALSLTPSVTTLPLEELLALMVALSDNDATNAVIDVVGIAAVQDLLERHGLSGTRLQRHLMDMEAAARGRDNVTCAADLARLLALLVTGELLPPVETDHALNLLASQQHVSGLPGALPPELWHGNKTGELVGLRHDMALFRRGERWAAVAVTATGLTVEGVDHGATVLPTFAAIGAAVAGSLGG
jgi:beta-lactamase class A